MPQADLLWNGVPGPYDQLIVGTPVTIANNDSGGETSWVFTLEKQPVGSTALLTGVGNSRSLTPDKPGTYIVKVVVQPGSLTDISSGAALYFPSDLREPAPKETTEWDLTDGWSSALTDLFERSNHGVGPKPPASAAVWGRIWHIPGGLGVADTFEVCIKDASNNYHWIDLTALYNNSIPLPTGHGYIPAGTTFTNQTVQQMFDAILYPPAQFSSFGIVGQPATLEVGQTIVSPKAFTWGVVDPLGQASQFSGEIFRVTGGSLSLVSGLDILAPPSPSIALPSNVQKVTVANHQWKIVASKIAGGTFERTATYNWYWATYHGKSINAILTPAQVVALNYKTIRSGYAGNYAVENTNPTPTYAYFCWPDSYGPGSTPTFIDTSTGFSIGITRQSPDLTVTNTYGISTTYRVYRSTVAFVADKIIAVS